MKCYVCGKKIGLQDSIRIGFRFICKDCKYVLS